MIKHASCLFLTLPVMLIWQFIKSTLLPALLFLHMRDFQMQDASPPSSSCTFWSWRPNSKNAVFAVANISPCMETTFAYSAWGEAKPKHLVCLQKGSAQVFLLFLVCCLEIDDSSCPSQSHMSCSGEPQGFGILQLAQGKSFGK